MTMFQGANSSFECQLIFVLRRKSDEYCKIINVGAIALREKFYALGSTSSLGRSQDESFPSSENQGLLDYKTLETHVAI